jgi:hypothetical protein
MTLDPFMQWMNLFPKIIGIFMLVTSFFFAHRGKYDKAAYYMAFTVFLTSH